MLECILMAVYFTRSFFLFIITTELTMHLPYLGNHSQGCNVSRCVANNAYLFQVITQCLSVFPTLQLRCATPLLLVRFFIFFFFVSFSLCFFSSFFHGYMVIIVYQNGKHLHTKVDKKNKSNNTLWLQLYTKEGD